ncbi:MAG: hypothetical protein ABR866_07410 [Candidatus Korobacteraceae bacterium]|jgi:hypothetical protein
MAKRTINLGGKQFSAEDIPFEAERESWNVYVLHDGTTLKIKTVLAEVLRVEGAWAPNGDPLYVVNASPVVSSNSPDSLKKKAEQ